MWNVELASQLKKTRFAEMQLSIQFIFHRPTNLTIPSLMVDLAQLELGLNLAKTLIIVATTVGLPT